MQLAAYIYFLACMTHDFYVIKLLRQQNYGPSGESNKVVCAALAKVRKDSRSYWIYYSPDLL